MWSRGDHEAAEKIWRRALEVADPEDGWARVRALNSLSINQTGGLGRPGPPTDEELRRALELWMNLWLVGLGMLLLVAAVVFVVYPRLRRVDRGGRRVAGSDTPRP